MSIKGDLSSSDVDAQIELLKFFPEIADRHYRPALVEIVQVLKDKVIMDVPVRSGHAVKTLGSRVMGTGLNIAGEVGWYGSRAPFYVRFVEGGAKPHEEQGYGSKGRGNKGFMKFEAGGGTVFTRSVKHPGTSARHFMQSAWDQLQPVVEMGIAQANEAIIQELIVP